MEPSAAPPPTLASSDHRQTIVVVDDDAALRAALTFSLEIEGFAVQTCESGEALLDLRLPAGSACLVVDQRLGGISGLDALEALRGRGDASPAIVITTTPTAILRERAARMGAEVIEKPLLGGGLVSAIRRLLSLRSAT